jgi:hypothetical protein
MYRMRACPEESVDVNGLAHCHDSRVTVTCSAHKQSFRCNVAHTAVKFVSTHSGVVRSYTSRASTTWTACLCVDRKHDDMATRRGEEENLLLKRRHAISCLCFGTFTTLPREFQARSCTG